MAVKIVCHFKITEITENWVGKKKMFSYNCWGEVEGRMVVFVCL